MCPARMSGNSRTRLWVRMSECGCKSRLWHPAIPPACLFLFPGKPKGMRIVHRACLPNARWAIGKIVVQKSLYFVEVSFVLRTCEEEIRCVVCHNLKFWVSFFPYVASATFGLDWKLCRLKRCYGCFCRVSRSNTTSAKRSVEILSWTVRLWPCRKKDMTDTFATQFSSDRPKVDVQDGNVERYNGRI